MEEGQDAVSWKLDQCRGGVVQSVSCAQLFLTPWTTYSTPGFPVLHNLLGLAQTHVH